MPDLYSILKASRLNPVAAPDGMTAIWAKHLMSKGGGYSQLTLTGVPPFEFYSNGDPIISLSMLGNTQQTGTPSPQSIIMPTFCGVRTANLFDMSDFSLLKVTSTAFRYGTSVGVLPQGSYTFSATKSAGAQSIYLTAKLNGTYSQTTISSVPFTFMADGDSEYIIRTANNTGTTWEAEKYSDMMLNSGSTALPYEPYGWAEKITCAGQTVPVYLGQTQTVRRVKKLVFDGKENWAAHASQANVYTLNAITDYLHAPSPAPLCSHYQTQITASAVSVADKRVALYYNQGQLSTSVLYIKDTDIATVADLKAYLAAQYAAGTPVTVWYVLATPETAIVNEPLAKIGDYVDELNIEATSVTIPTSKGVNTLTVDTALQPSSATITYLGRPINSI